MSAQQPLSLDVQISEITAAELDEYATVPSAFRVMHRLSRPTTRTGSPLPLVTQPVSAPYEKDYDAFDGAAPTEWPSRFDLSRWGLFTARRRDRVIGGAAIAPSTADVLPPSALLVKTATLWDLRVARTERRRGIGALLFRAAERWAVDRGCRALIVETQDVNVAASHFYQAMGCELLSFEPDAYVDAPGEARLIWRRTL